MSSPFPGMDPYLEDPAFWPDFHATFVNYWREEVAARLPDHYEARLDEQVHLVQIPAGKPKRVRPDVSITRDAGADSSHNASSTVGMLEPTTVPLLVEEETRQTYIEYAWSVRDPLPTVPIPLLPEDGEVAADLAAVFATTYERGRYARSLDYGAAAPISADAETAAWIGQQAK